MMAETTLHVLTAAALLGAAACTGSSVSDIADPSVSPAGVVVIDEAWLSVGDTAWDVDTPALWTDGSRSLVVVTAKATHDLKLFDGVDGSFVRSIGTPGQRPGQFQRPNGVIVEGDYAIVVERDNRRIQVLRMPEGTPLGVFGQEVLEYPYGIAAMGTPTELRLWVTDDYEYEEDVVPADLTHRVHGFEVALSTDQAPKVRNHWSFGAPAGEGSLRVVESIQVDPDRERLLIADESRKSYLEYDLAGRFRDRTLGVGAIDGDPEGIMLVRCGVEAGFWIVTDQQDEVSLFKVFDRTSLEPRGTFRGRTTANTDGATFVPGPVPGFPRGVMYAVHDDQAISAFDWGRVVDALGLGADCLRS